MSTGPVNPVPTPPQQSKFSIKSVAKFVTALLGAGGEAITLGLFTGTAAKWVGVGIALATALGVYIVPNKKQ